MSSTGCRQLSTSEKETKRRETLDRFLRVDHAGEYGADRIYAGQLAVLGKNCAVLAPNDRQFRDDI